jgi:copper chaperone CopZ
LTVSRFAKLLQILGVRHDESTGVDRAGTGPFADVEFLISNMVCEGCAEKIDGVLHAVAGVRDIRANVAQKRVHVRYEPAKVRPEQLKDAVSRAGFTAVEA